MSDRRHTSREYERELREIKENIIYMGAIAEEAIQNGITALVNRDSELARRTIQDEDLIDKLDVAIEEKCIRLLALRQPAAIDLRFITTAIKINAHLERIGDMAAKIAEKAIILNSEPPLKPYVDLPRMANVARLMIKESLDAFVTGNIDLANKVRRDDEIVDSLNEQTFRELLTFMMEDHRNIHRAMIITQVSKTIERISDHATGIADMVIFMITGHNVRHQSPSTEEKG